MGTLGAAVSVVSHRTGAQAQTETVGANDRIRVAVMGVNGSGSWLAKTFAADSRAEVVALCDIDSRVGGVLADSFSKDGRKVPRLESDFRRLLDDTSIDVLVVATPNHWHAPATILACNAGKHVYVEKPCGHTPEEGELAVTAARKHKRVVTMGSLTIGGGGDYKIFDANNKELESPQQKGGDRHIANFLDCVASGALPHADIEEAHKSTLLCQLGNISYRAGPSPSTRATDGHIENDPEAAALWRPEYRDQWQPKVTGL